jgi:hypothetical protein
MCFLKIQTRIKRERKQWSYFPLYGPVASDETIAADDRLSVLKSGTVLIIGGKIYNRKCLNTNKFQFTYIYNMCFPSVGLGIHLNVYE